MFHVNTAFLEGGIFLYKSIADNSGGVVSKIKCLLMRAGILACCSGRAVADGPGFNTGIEGMDSQQWSVGIFVFLIFCILVFTVIVLKFMTTDRVATLKRGEKVLFAWILFGVVAAIIIGALQLLQGRLL